ncbi:hypothetical protein THRCLA_11340 [Thraustotheca clavata]|uniref:Uncharacterized protein n=1 Tax=Thraustotheca clavata TaxID=74557 RepID=A0A1V9Y829_9STRA|nr:hypothetical protein THRCLA_11340 [Thraustotheca clavata]
MTLYDWAYNEREVVSFQADYGTYTLMTYISPPQPPSRQIEQQNMAIYNHFVVNALVLYRSLGSPWFMFNRIVSGIWLNCSFLFIRGVAAVMCLSSPTIFPVANRTGVRFIDVPRSLLISSLFAGEATWIAYILHDMLHPLTGAYTKRYATLSCCYLGL